MARAADQQSTAVDRRLYRESGRGGDGPDPVLKRLAAAGLKGLETLLVTDCPTQEWQSVLRDSAIVII
jgi:hypothetical protein